VSSWPARADELVRAQLELAAARPAPWRPVDPMRGVGACFVCFPRGAGPGPGAAGDRAWAAAALADRGRLVATAIAGGTAGAPYQAGLLALREGPLVETAVRALALLPDVLLVDATGRDHPRRAGLALHLGAVLDVPTVGVTHRPLAAAGDWPGPERGSRSPLLLDGEIVGAWLRTRRGVRPLAVHPAWRTSLDVAVAVVLAVTAGRSRAPEPMRAARSLARAFRAASAGGPR
jgi:deoxyribonuclease V